MFNSADVALITKIDLAEACEFDRETAMANLHAVRPDMRIFEISSKKGTGMAEWLDYLADIQRSIKQDRATGEERKSLVAAGE